MSLVAAALAALLAAGPNDEAATHLRLAIERDRAGDAAGALRQYAGYLRLAPKGPEREVARQAMRLDTARDVNHYMREQTRRILPEVVS